MTVPYLLIAPLIAVAAIAYGIATGRARARRLLPASSTISGAKYHHWLLAGLAIGAVLLAIPSYKIAAAKGLLSQQFHLPAEIDIQDVRRSDQYGAMTEGRAQFTEAQFQAYISKLDDPAVWAPVPLRWNGELIRDGLNLDLQRWHGLPGPLLAGQAPKHILDMPRIYDWWDPSSIKQGRILCFVIRQEAIAPSQHDLVPRASGLRAMSCTEATKRDRLLALVFGVLDYDTRTLHMKIKNSRVLTASAV